MGADIPKRGIIVSGQDWGKLWLIHGVWMEVALSQELPLLSTFQLNAATGIQPVPMDVSTFVSAMTTKVLNPKITAMSAEQFAPAPPIPLFTVQASVTLGQVVPQAINPFPAGPFWNLIRNFSDSPWNELFTSDSDETGPVVVFRPTPYKDINGSLLNGAADPGTILLDHSDVVAIEVGRSDEHCANFFWVPPGAALMFLPNMVTAWSLVQGDPFDFHHPNNDPALYGYRKMEWPTQLMPALPVYPLEQPQPQQVQSAAAYSQWHITRAQALRDMNRDNVLFEDGVIRARGREDFTPASTCSSPAPAWCRVTI
jgi:hypothetical protein